MRPFWCIKRRVNEMSKWTKCCEKRGSKSSYLFSRWLLWEDNKLDQLLFADSLSFSLWRFYCFKNVTNCEQCHQIWRNIDILDITILWTNHLLWTVSPDLAKYRHFGQNNLSIWLHCRWGKGKILVSGCSLLTPAKTTWRFTLSFLVFWSLQTIVLFKGRQ